jgi:dTDP-4-amino-4,6-dideoxygalactose transaminase
VSPPFIPFNRPYATGGEFDCIRAAIANAHLAGNGAFSRRCEAWLQREIGCAKALLTHSGTAALEMSALLLDIRPGDEVIMPSFTFVSTANAFALRGGVPVFVDIRADTLNIDERLIEPAITPRTRAIVAVHYAGVACEMGAIAEVARRHGVSVIEDAAQALGATYRGRPLGSFGELAAVSFHETKNVIAGEGGALLINDAEAVGRAEILREKGTDRSRFFRGEVDKYTWVDVGSSFLPSELTAAFLWAQMQSASDIHRRRTQIWDWYYQRLAGLERRGRLRRPTAPAHCGHNAHLFYVLVEPEVRPRLLEQLNRDGINAVFHFVPLHNSPAGLKFARTCGPLPRSESLSASVVRLPMWIGLTESDVDRVGSALERHLG